jgi:hypothetical protein
MGQNGEEASCSKGKILRTDLRREEIEYTLEYNSIALQSAKAAIS